MTAQADLKAMLDGQPANSGPDAIAAAEQLAALLKLDTVGLSIRSARIVGRGSKASADLRLSDGTEIVFERLKDFANPTALAIEVAACTGATPTLKVPQALIALSLLRAIAEHQETVTVDQLSFEWGVAYLQSAVRHELDMNDQAARWDAFCNLERVDAVAKARQDGVTVAQASVLLIHADGTRFVRCGWFRHHVKADDASVSPQEIAHRMERVGWRRRGQTGRIKATRPGHKGSLAWSFYAVPAGWEDDR